MSCWGDYLVHIFTCKGTGTCLQRPRDRRSPLSAEMARLAQGDGIVSAIVSYINLNCTSLIITLLIFTLSTCWQVVYA